MNVTVILLQKLVAAVIAIMGRRIDGPVDNTDRQRRSQVADKEHAEETVKHSIVNIYFVNQAFNLCTVLKNKKKHTVTVLVLHVMKPGH